MTLNEFLNNLTHVNLAVVLDDGRPWVVTVSVQKYEHGTIEWFSKTRAQHSQAIHARPDVALSAYTTKRHKGGEFGFYAHATAAKVYTLPGGISRYRAQITDAWRTDSSKQKHKILKREL